MAASANQQAMWNRIRASQKSNIRAVSGKGNTTLFSSGAVGPTVAGFMGTPALTTLALANKESKGYVNQGVLNIGYDRLDDSKTIAEWREKFPRAKHLNISGRELTDADFQYFAGLESLNISECVGFTDAAFVHLRGIKKLDMWGCPDVTDAAFVNLKGIQMLSIATCEGITDAAFEHLRGIHTLDISYCDKLTDAAFENLRGIHTLSMKKCYGITDAAFVNLAGIHTLDMLGCDHGGITDAAFAHLSGINTLDMSECNQEGITDAIFTHLRGIQNLNMKLCSQRTLTGDNLASLGCNLKTLGVRYCNERLIDNAKRLYGVTQSDSSVKRYAVECSRTPGKLGFKLPALYQGGGSRQTRKGRKMKSRTRKSRKRR